MTTPEKQVRVFISSTFRDMHAERDHLVTVVFPELRERVEQLGLEFFDVDLRWGVPVKGADGEKANSWEYCKKWINEVEPFFVCMLGQRYGYQPKPQDLKAEGDRRLQESEDLSITEMEVRHALLHEPEKRRSYFYLRETIAPKPKSDASEEERKLYGNFVDGEPAATKLTTLKDKITKCGRPVRDYECRWTGKEFADLDKVEKRFGPMVLEDLWSGVLRDERYVSKEVWRQVLGADPDSDARYTDESKPVPPDIAEKLVALAKPVPLSSLDADKQQMEAFAKARLRWFQGRTGELQQLNDFINSTDADAPRLAVVAAVPGQGKSALLARLWQTISFAEQGRARSPLRADSADSAKPLPEERRARSDAPYLITHFVGATERSANAHALVERLLGELDRSGIAWPAEQQEGQEPKRDFNSLCLRLAQRLGDYAGERRIVILLDALNQLSDGHDLQWLPTRLGSGVRVIVSCVEDASSFGVPALAGPDRLKAELQTNEPSSNRREENPSTNRARHGADERGGDGPSPDAVSPSTFEMGTGRPHPVRWQAHSSTPGNDQSLLTSAATVQEHEQRVLRALASRQPAPLRVPLGPLTEDDVRTIVVEYLAEYCHELDREHLDTLCAITQARNPLYLLVMLNELRTLGGNDLNLIVPARIASMPQDHPDTVSLFR